MRTRQEIEADAKAAASVGEHIIIELLLDIRDQNTITAMIAQARVENERDAMLASAGIQSSGS